ncbi:MAG: ATP-binding protein [Planctomycetales bacterium]
MKLIEIQVDRCGNWRDLTLPLEARGLSVLYGPNEAGKSTLVRFVRSVLYGFESNTVLEDRAALLAASGSLLVEDASGTHRLHRAAGNSDSDRLSIIGETPPHPPEQLLTGWLQGIDEQLFQSVFAIDLRQLQELGLLSGDEADSRVYGLSLGPAGRRLLSAARRGGTQQAQWIGGHSDSGALGKLFERQAALQGQLQELDASRQRHAELCQRRDRLELEIEDLRQRQSGIQEQLRGHQFLERSWGPWRHVRDCQNELEGLPTIVDFPQRGLERLNRVEAELATALEARDRLRGAAKKLRDQCRAEADAKGLRLPAGIMQGFVEQRSWLMELEQRLEGLRQRASQAQADLDAQFEALGPEWTPERLAALDLSAAGWQRLSGTSRSLQEANGRRHALRRKSRRQAIAYRDLRDGLTEALEDLDGLTVDAALTQARERLREVKHLARMQLREAELSQRQFSLHEYCDRLTPQLTLPRWVYIVLGVFCFMGVVLAGWGLIAGVATSGIAGTIYALLGITCGGLAWGLKTQYEGDAQRRMEEAQAHLATTAGELETLRTTIQTLIEPQPSESPDTPAAPAQADAGEIVRVAAERVSELFELARHQRSLRAMRRRLQDSRQKLVVATRETRTARAAWRDLLSELGLPQSVPSGEALETWQRLLETQEYVQRRDQALADLSLTEGLWNACRLRITDFGRRLDAWDVDYDQPLAVLATWERQLVELAQRRKEFRELKQRRRAMIREASDRQARVEELQVQRHALLVQGGAGSAEEFAERARIVARRSHLEDQCASAQLGLEAVCAEHGDLALVDEDLAAYDPHENARCIATLRDEAADLARDLQQAFEQLGGVKNELGALEEDRRGTSLRFELELVRQELREATREWAIVETCAQACDEVRRDHERRHQPAALIGASRLLERLTHGRYRTVWTPLGERRLLIEDDRGRNLPVSALSRGTREQLFLAVRLAVVEDLARQGVQLPVLLDDVFVNFDERRSEAAAEVLCQFADEGHQVLFFTCHQYLAEMFRAKGVAPIRLPERPAEEDQVDQRHAG